MYIMYYNPYIRRAGTLTPGLTTNRKCLHVQYIEGRKPYFTNYDYLRFNF